MKKTIHQAVWCIFWLFLLLPFQEAQSQCTVPSFGRSITINNPYATPLTDYVIKVPVNTQELNTAGKLSNPFGFVMVGPDCSVQLSYWPEDSASFPDTLAYYYVKVPLIPASSSVIVNMNYGPGTTCLHDIQDVFDSLGNAQPAASPVGFAANTTWEVSQLSFPIDAYTYRWDVRASAPGNIRPKTTYTIGSSQFVQDDGTLEPLVPGLNSIVNELEAEASGHPGFFSGLGLLMIGDNCGLCNAVKSANGDLPPNTAPLNNNVSNDPKLKVWYRPRAAQEPIVSLSEEFDLSASPAILPAGALSICEGDSVTVWAPTGFLVYNWYLDGVLLQSSPDSAFTFSTSGLGGGSHTLDLDGFYSACDSASTTRSFNANPTARIDSLLPNSICQGSPFTPAALISMNGATISQYQWDFGDGNNGTGASPSHTYLTSGALNLGLVVVTDSGCTDTLTEALSVFSKPNIDSISAVDICWPNLTSFSQSSNIPGNWNGASITNYAWDFGDGNTSTLANPSHGYSVPNPYAHTLTVTTSDGCTDTLGGMVEIWPKPSINSLNDPNTCWPQAVNFSQTTTLPNNWNGASLMDYYWGFGNGNNGSGNSVSHIYSLPARYADTLIVTTSDMCRDTVTDSVDVYPKPVIDSVNTMDLCWPETSPYEGFISIPHNWNSTTLTQTDWDFGDGNTSTANPSSHAFSTPNAYAYTFEVVTANACGDTTTGTVNQWPKPDITSINETDVCWPENVVFTQTSSIPNNWNTASLNVFDWRFGDGNSGSNGTETHGYAIPGLYSDTLMVTTNDACQDTLTGSVQVWPKPSIDSILTQDVCEPSTVEFDQQTTIPHNWSSATLITYNWDFGDGNQGTGPQVSHTYATQDTFTVQLIVTTSDNCRDTLDHRSDRTSESPWQDFNFTDICFGEAMAL